MNGARVTLYPLSFVDESDEVVIGRAEIESYAVFPSDAAEIVRRLRDGAGIDEVGLWYAEQYGESADIGDLVETLRSLGFVREDGEEGAAAPGRDILRFRRLARALFSPAAWALYTAAVAASCYGMARDPWLRPGPSRLQFDNSLLMLLLVLFLSQLVGVAWHESFHVLAARRLGVPARLGVGRRLYFLVFQTTLTGLMGVPRAKRILPFCAGLVADALYGSTLIGIAALCHTVGGAASGPGRAAMTALYLTVLRMAWQFLVFMETDIYYVLVHLLRIPDLHALSRTFLRNRGRLLLRQPGRTVDQSGLGTRERAVIRVYAPLMFGCSAVMMAGMFTVALPAIGELARTFAHGIATWDVADPHWWDSLLALVIVLLEPALAGAMAVREYLGARRSARRHAPGVTTVPTPGEIYE